MQLERAAEMDGHGLERPRDLPRVGPRQPAVHLLVLPAVAERLLEHAVLVAKARSHARKCERRHRIEKTGGEPPKASVAETGVGFRVEDVERIDFVTETKIAPERIRQQVGDVVRERTAYEELERQ